MAPYARRPTPYVPPPMRSLAFTLLAITLLPGCLDNAPVEQIDPVYIDRTPSTFQSPPIPIVLPVPSPQQLAFQKMETNAIIHIGLNTFTGNEWENGTADPKLFNPKNLDARQWAYVLKNSGIKGVVFVTKHIDGFLLWPSNASTYSVKRSPWRNGNGNLVQEVATAMREAGLELGFYLAPWDQNNPYWGTRQYNDFFVATMLELFDDKLSQGSLYSFWLDYAHDFNVVTPAHLATYDEPRWIYEIRKNHPGAIIAPDRDAFYPGNEAGAAPVDNWSFRSDFPRWAPYECDYTLRGADANNHSWYWHPNEHPRPLDEMVEIYFKSVGRGCSQLIGVAPDTSGLISNDDASLLQEWRHELNRIFQNDVARHTTATASSVRPGSPGWGPGAAIDGNADSFWASDSLRSWMEVTLEAPQTVNIIQLAEPIKYGQRVLSFHVDAFQSGSWTTVARGTSINYKRLIRIAPVTAQRWRLVIDNARAAPAISQFELYPALNWASRWGPNPA